MVPNIFKNEGRCYFENYVDISPDENASVKISLALLSGSISIKSATARPCRSFAANVYPSSARSISLPALVNAQLVV